uniref:C-type lectin domain-containing protein n=1 Tax=Knipowitschia caucasica TaxID=637954 RepID=A0AAV2LVV1_KNICA
MLIPQPSGRDGGPTSQRKRCRATSHKSARAFFNLQSRKDNLGPTWAGSLSQERQTPSQPILTAEVSRPPLLRAPTPLHTTLFLQTGPHRGLTGASCFHTPFYTFHFISQSKSWFEAQQFCREHYSDLATVRDQDDLLRLRRHGPFTGYAWIGLFDDPAAWTDVVGNESNSWRWSATGNTSSSRYQNWSPGEPTFSGAVEACLYFQSGQWLDGNCAVPLYFVCFSGFPRPGFKNFTFVAIAKTWAESRSYCRQHHTDLAMIQDQSENSAVLAISSTYQVWVGLYREPWRWSDGSTSSFTNWMNVQPGNSRGIEHCVLKNIYHQWNDGVCSQTYPFFCQRGETRTYN